MTNAERDFENFLFIANLCDRTSAAYTLYRRVYLAGYEKGEERANERMVRDRAREEGAQDK